MLHYSRSWAALPVVKFGLNKFLTQRSVERYGGPAGASDPIAAGTGSSRIGRWGRPGTPYVFWVGRGGTLLTRNLAGIAGPTPCAARDPLKIPPVDHPSTASITCLSPSPRRVGGGSSVCSTFAGDGAEADGAAMKVLRTAGKRPTVITR